MPLRLQFARLAFGKSTHIGHVPDKLAAAMESVKPFDISGSSARYYLRDYGARIVDDREVFAATIGAAAGEKAKVLNDDAGTEVTVDLPGKKVENHAEVLVDSAGNIVYEAKSVPLKAEQVRDAFEKALRLGLGVGAAFSLTPTPIHASAKIMRKWIEDLDELHLVRITNLRHSNPHPPIAYLDTLTEAMVDEIVERSSAPGGIDKEMAVVDQTLDHAEAYGRIATAEGMHGGTAEKIEDRDGEIHLTITAKGKDKHELMFRALKRYTTNPPWKKP